MKVRIIRLHKHSISVFDDFFISSQPNYVPPSIDGCTFEVQTMDGEEGNNRRGK